jgi:hypothetical protein
MEQGGYMRLKMQQKQEKERKRVLTDNNAKVGSDEVQRRRVCEISHHAGNARQYGSKTDDGVEHGHRLG